jgi:hypothetical protein
MTHGPSLLRLVNAIQRHLKHAKEDLKGLARSRPIPVNAPEEDSVDIKLRGAQAALRALKVQYLDVDRFSSDVVDRAAKVGNHVFGMQLENSRHTDDWPVLADLIASLPAPGIGAHVDSPFESNALRYVPLSHYPLKFPRQLKSSLKIPPQIVQESARRITTTDC